MAHALSPIGKGCMFNRCGTLFLSNSVSFFRMQTVGDTKNLKIRDLDSHKGCKALSNDHMHLK